MTTQPDVALTPVAARATGSGNDLNHIYCCDPEVALCNTDLSAVPEGWTDVPNCVVCEDLDEAEIACCPTCPNTLNGA